MSDGTPYGFHFGPMAVERIAHDERIGWVVTIRPTDAWEPRVEVRCSPAGRKWSARVIGAVAVSDE